MTLSDFMVKKQVFKNSYEWDKQLSISTNHNINTRLEIYNITTIANIYYEQKEASNERLMNDDFLFISLMRSKKGINMDRNAEVWNIEANAIDM